MESGNTFTRFLVDKYIDRNMLSFVFPSLQSGWMALFQSGRSLGGATANNTGAAVDRSNSQSSTTYLLYLSTYLSSYTVCPRRRSTDAEITEMVVDLCYLVCQRSPRCKTRIHELAKRRFRCDLCL